MSATATTHTIDIAAFIAFCRSKPEGERYNWSDSDNCALAQFARHKHPEAEVCEGGAWSYWADDVRFCFASEVEDDASSAVEHHPHTFSALADRLAELGR